MPKPCAYNLVRDQPVYRRDAFDAGLNAAGFEVKHAVPQQQKPCDILVMWSRYFGNHDLATKFEAAGGTVLIAENGYLAPSGLSPHHMEHRSVYALARHAHNDSTVIPEGDDSRWRALGVELKAWRTDGKHILVCPNRPFGMPGRIMPANWAEDVAGRLRKLTNREIRIRPHPGNEPPRKPLSEDLRDCWAVVIWSSSAGVHALVAGIPVVCEAPYWICNGAAETDINDTDALEFPWIWYQREPDLNRLAWAQWTLKEIQTGEAFTRLLGDASRNLREETFVQY